MVFRVQSRGSSARGLRQLRLSVSFVSMPVKTSFIKTDLILYTEKKPTTFRLYGHEKLILLYVNDYNMKSN